MYRCHFGRVSRADGSVALCDDRRVFWASVHGPADCKMSRQLPRQAFLEILIKPCRSEMQSNALASLVSIANSVFNSCIMVKSYPRSQISLAVQQLSEEEFGFETVYSLTINSLMLALLDAGISLRCIVGAVTVAIGYSEEHSDSSGPAMDTNQLPLYINPDAGMLRSLAKFALVTLVFEKSDEGEHKVISMHSHRINSPGVASCPISEQTMEALILEGQKAIGCVFDFYQTALNKKYSREN